MVDDVSLLVLSTNYRHGFGWLTKSNAIQSQRDKVISIVGGDATVVMSLT